MRVLHVNDESHEAIPKAERHDESEHQQRPDRPAAVHAPNHQAAHPQGAEGRHQQTVPGVADASSGHMLSPREEKFLPPHLDHVIHALADTAAVNALQPPPNPRQARKFGGRVGCPHVVAALEIGESMVREVMADFPQAVRRQGRQECNSADPFVERLIGRVGAMAGVMTDHEQTSDPKRRHQRCEHLHPPGFNKQQTGDRHPEHEPIQQEPNDRRGDAALDREWLQQFLKFEARLIGSQRRFIFGVRGWG